MSKFTSNSIAAIALPPESITAHFFQSLISWQFDEFMFTMGEPAFIAIITISEFRKSFAELGFMLERIGFRREHVLISHFRLVAFGGSLFKFLVI